MLRIYEGEKNILIVFGLIICVDEIFTLLLFLSCVGPPDSKEFHINHTKP